MHENAAKQTPARRRLFTPIAIVLTCGTAIAYVWARMLSVPLPILLPTTTGLPCAILLAAYWYQHGCGSRSRGAVLLDCGPHPAFGRPTEVLGLLGISALISGLLGFAYFAEHASDDMPDLTTTARQGCLFLIPLLAVMLVLLSPSLMLTLGHCQIREHGVWAYFRLLRWEKIEYCKWEFGCTLIVQVKSRIPSFGTVRVRIPEALRTSAIEILRERCRVIE